MSFIDDYDNAHVTTFNQRVRVAMLQVGHGVVTEDPTTANHVQRAGLLLEVMSQQDTFAQLFSDVICAAYGCTGDSDTDENILQYVGQVWTDFAPILVSSTGAPNA